MPIEELVVAVLSFVAFGQGGFYDRNFHITSEFRQSFYSRYCSIFNKFLSVPRNNVEYATKIGF